MDYLNGSVHKKLQIIENDVKEIKEDLPHAISQLTTSVNNLTGKLDTFMHVAERSVPIRAVFWLMAIMVLGLVGVEGVKAIGPTLKSMFGGI